MNDEIFELGEQIEMAEDATADRIKAGVWQYLIDHTTPHPRGYVIRFVVASEGDFWWRVEQRSNGTYKRNNAKIVAKRVDGIIYGSAKRAQLDREIYKMSQEAMLYWRFLIKMRSFLNKRVENMAKKRTEGKRFKWYTSIE